MVRRIPEDEWPLPTRTVGDDPDALSQAIESLPEYGEAVIVERDGKRMGAIIPMADLELYQRLFAEEEDRIDIAAIEALRAEAGGTENMIANAIPIEELLQKYASGHPD